MTVIFRISHAPEPALHARAIHGCPMVITDTIEPLQSMATGEWHTSKRGMRAEYKRLGMVEMGNEQQKPFVKPKPDRQAIKAAVSRAFSRAGLGA